ncbi:putative ribonuclease H-like domain-containing protein [Tanacetum coccineum]|uniref:Ribonuclease H-like domain-containing protein n=1 Tax=Tanacetum coccineum TaxID=301880 RepID=A0ABQ5HMG8_9ASTR
MARKLRSVQLNAGRPKFNSVRPNINTGWTNINSGRPKVNTVSSNINTVRSRQPVPHKTSNSFSPKRPQMNQINQRRDFSKSYSSVRRPFAKSTAQMAHSNAVMGSWGSAVKTSASYNWRNSRPNFNYNSGPTFIRTVHPLKNMVDRGIFDSGCSGHMTGNKDQLEDFEEFNGGSVTFGGSKGYISGKGRIRVGHINFKNLNKLVKGNLVRGLPSKVFKNDHTCVACHKGKQHRASCKAKLERLITVPLHTLHMDLFGPTSVRSINHASYCLVITDDCTRFSWVFFLASKDETSGILQTFIRQIENQLSHRVKIIRSDNGTEFKNRDMLEFCGNKGIKQEYSNARTPQQNGVAERMNRTLIEAARTMLADSLLPTTFWAEAVSTACYIFNRCAWQFVKSDEGFLVDKPNVKGVGYRWMFDIDYLTDSMNYIPVSLENQANSHAGASEVTNSAGTSQTPKSIASEKNRMRSRSLLLKEETLNRTSKREESFLTDSLEDIPKIQLLEEELEENCLKLLGNVVPKKIAEALKMTVGFSHARRTVTVQATTSMGSCRSTSWHGLNPTIIL